MKLKLPFTVATALLSLSICAMAQQGTGAANATNAGNPTGQTYGPNNNPGLNNISPTGQQNSQFGRDTATNAQTDATTDQTTTDSKAKAKKKVNKQTDPNTNTNVKHRAKQKVDRTQTKTGTED